MSRMKLDLSRGPTRHIVGDDRVSFWLSLCHVAHSHMAVAWGFGLPAYLQRGEVYGKVAAAPPTKGREPAVTVSVEKQMLLHT